MKQKSKILYIFTELKSGYIILAAIVIAVIMVSSVVFELSQSKEEIRHLMKDNAVSLIETIIMSSKNAVLSNEEIEDLISLRLLSAANMVARLETTHDLTQKELEQIANENEIFRINIFDKDGNKVLSSLIPDSSHLKKPSKHEPKEFFQPILDGEEDQIIIGLKEARHEEGKRFAVAVRRKKSPGAIVVNVDASYLLEFRKKIGFGKMIQDIGTSGGIVYIILQDEKGIIAASKDVQEINPIASDSFLINAYKGQETSTREFIYSDYDVFEVVKTFKVENEIIGLFRIGLSTDELRAVDIRSSRRVVIVTIILFFMSMIVLSIIFVKQNLKILNTRYRSIQTYTGNILENMTDAVITCDGAGNITIFNKKASEMLGVGEDEVIGKDFRTIEPLNNKQLLDSFINISKLENFEFIYNLRNLVADTMYTLKGDGSIDAFTIVIRDITEQRKFEANLIRQEKVTAMGELASGVAHEIRNPLNAIGMIAQRLKKEFKPAEEKAEEFANITNLLLNETKRVNQIIEQFLKFSRPPKLQKEKILSQAFINDIKILTEPLVTSKGISFLIDSSDEFVLKIDKDLMKQVLLNLIQNAVDSTDSGGKIIMSVKPCNNKAIFVVEDTGSGIPADIINKIFNLYFTTKTKGTGLGLSIVQQIVSQHDGIIQVESTVGKGSKFTIEIPI